MSHAFKGDIIHVRGNTFRSFGDIIQVRGDIVQVIGLSYSGQLVILFRSEVI